jgi:hypothetical protein
MSLLTTVQSAAQTAKDATVSLWQDITYVEKTSRSYNTTTGAVTEGETSHSLKALVTKYDVEELNIHVEGADLKAMVLQSELTPTPKKDDVVTYDSRDFVIVDFGRDLSNSFWYLQLR